MYTACSPVLPNGIEVRTPTVEMAAFLAERPSTPSTPLEPLTQYHIPEPPSKRGALGTDGSVVAAEAAADTPFPFGYNRSAITNIKNGHIPSSLFSALNSLPKPRQETHSTLLKLIVQTETKDRAILLKLVWERLASLWKLSNEQLHIISQGLVDFKDRETIPVLRIVLIFTMSNDLIKIDRQAGLEIIRECRCILDLDFFRQYRVSTETRMQTVDAFAEAVLRSAIYAGDVDIVQRVGQMGFSPNELVLAGQTPLRIALIEGHDELASFLIRTGAGVNARVDPYSRTALELAARRGKPNLVRLIIAAGGHVDGGFVDEGYNYVTSPRPALYEAVKNDDIESVELLLSAGATKTLDNALCIAAHKGNLSTVKLLLSVGADVNQSVYLPNLGNYTALRAAAESGSLELVEFLLESDATNVKGAITSAATINNIEIVQVLLRAGVDVNDDRIESPLMHATRHGNVSMARLLLHNGANVDRPSSRFDCLFVTPLIVATRNRNIGLVQLFCSAGASLGHPKSCHNTDNNGLFCHCRNFHGDPLQIAASLGDLTLTKVLLDAGADVDSAPSPFKGRTALQAAICSGNLILVRYLLNAGAFVDSPAANNDGRTALQQAAEVGELIMIKYLLVHGANIDGHPSPVYGMTALVAAIKSGDEKSVHRLIIAGADINHPSAKLCGYTALAAAAERDDLALVQYILRLGADPVDPVALYCSVINENDMMFEALREAVPLLYGKRRGKYACLALRAAVQKNSVPLVASVLSTGVNVNANLREDELPIHMQEGASHTRTPLQIGVTTQDSEIVEMLLLEGANPDTTTTCSVSPLELAVSADCVLLVKILLKRSWAKRGPSLALAIRQGKATILKAFLDHGVDIETPYGSHPSQTPLQTAVERGDMELVSLLLAYGAKVNAPAPEPGGMTALQWAAAKGHFGIMCKLLEHNAIVNEPAAKYGQTALEAAARYGRIDALQLLLDNGARIDGIWQNQYQKALKMAVKGGFHTAHVLLLKFVMKQHNRVYLA